MQTLLTLPIVSDLSKCLTKLCSFFIESTLYAKAIVTAIGKPSGMATTMTVTAMINALTKTSIAWAEIKDIPAASIKIHSLIIIREPIKIAII